MKIPERLRKVRVGGVLLMSFNILVLTFILLPILIVILTSLAANGSIDFPPSGLSLRWYALIPAFFANTPGLKPGLLTSLVLSVGIALVVSISSVLLGSLASYAIVRYEFRGKKAFEQVFSLPLIYPQLVTGISLLMFVSAYLKTVTILERLLIAHMIIALPFVVRNCIATLQKVPKSMEEAAQTLGAGRIQTFFRITLPLMKTGLVAGAILGFMMSTGNFIISYFLYSGDARPLPMWMWERVTNGLDSQLCAISAVIITMNFVGLYLVNKVAGLGKIAI